jgi:hypothetical protein
MLEEMLMQAKANESNQEVDSHKNPNQFISTE